MAAGIDRVMWGYRKPPDVTEKTGRGDPAPEAVEDPIADALVSGSTYERMRATRLSIFGQPVPQRLGWQAAVLGVLALVAPLWITAPPAVRAAAGPAGSPTAVVVGLLAAGVAVLGAAGLAGAAAVRVRADDLDAGTAARLLAVEEAGSLLGLGTGGVATAVTVFLFALGRLGPRAVASYGAVVGSDPFAPSGLGVGVTAVAGAALAGAAACLAASHALDAALADA